MDKYHKIQTVYLRDPKTNFRTLLEGVWSKKEFEVLQDINWICTEKIDGTNIRIILSNGIFSIRGKSDNTQIPPFLLDKLNKLFCKKQLEDIFETEADICLYGEGYGQKIQKGGNYLPDSNNFILFDIRIGKWWLTRKAIEVIAKKLEISIVPIIGIWKLKTAIEFVKQGFKSTIADNEDYMAEGLVMKPQIELYNRSGERVVTKIKHKDFK